MSNAAYNSIPMEDIPIIEECSQKGVVGVIGMELTRTQSHWRPEYLKSMSEYATNLMEELNPPMVITDLSSGWGMFIAKACLDLKIPYVAVIGHYNSGYHLKPDTLCNMYYDLYTKSSKCVVLTHLLDLDHLKGIIAYTKKTVAHNCTTMHTFWDWWHYSALSYCLAYTTCIGVPITNHYDTWKAQNEDIDCG